MGASSSETLSRVIGRLSEDIDDDVFYSPMKSGKLSKFFVRNTNSSGVYLQHGSTCYAFAACSAYINTILRIYGSRRPPTFRECFEIAAYNGTNGGEPAVSLGLLEAHFNYGIRYDTVKPSDCSIRDAMILSLIVCFTTSDKGWECVKDGALVKFPGGESDEWHASVVEGYDFYTGNLICKNSWGGITATPRFLFSPNAAHACEIIRVYYTLDSIRGKTTKDYSENYRAVKGTLENKQVRCAWMDEKTATYCSDFICEYRPEGNGEYKYFGYNVNDWINVYSPFKTKI